MRSRRRQASKVPGHRMRDLMPQGCPALNGYSNFDYGLNYRQSIERKLMSGFVCLGSFLSLRSRSAAVEDHANAWPGYVIERR
jgi:hypothetical protein